MNKNKSLDINKRIKLLLKTLGYSQKMFAEKIGVTPQYVGRLCKNGSVGSKAIERLKENTGVNVDWLLTGKGEILEKDNVDLELKNQRKINLFKKRIRELESQLKDKEKIIKLLTKNCK